MRVGLIDVDGHRFPNLCLMKLSAYHKARGDTVEWYDSGKWYDLVYMSRVFTDSYSKDYEGSINAYPVIKGGMPIVQYGFLAGAECDYDYCCDCPLHEECGA